MGLYQPAPTWDDIRRGIFAGESGGDYDAIFGYANRDPASPFAGVRPTEMTLGQLKAFTNPKGSYGRWVAGQNNGTVATPTGAYQVVGTTLRAAQDALGLSDDTLYDAATQDAIGRWVYENQGTGAWTGYKGPIPEGGDVKGGGVGIFPEEDPLGIPGAIMSSKGGGGGGNGQATGGRIPPATRGDKWRIALQAFSEGMGALGSGHAADFEATDAFVNRLAQERYLNAQAPGQLDPTVNATITALETTYGRPDLADDVRNGADPEKALEKARSDPSYKRPDQAFSPQQQEIWGRVTDDFAPVQTYATNSNRAATQIYDLAEIGNVASDNTIVTLITKMIDPNSVSMPAEVKTVADGLGGAASIVQRVQGWFDPEKGFLTPTARAEAVRMVKLLNDAALKTYGTRRDISAQRLSAAGVDPQLWLDNIAGAEMPSQFEAGVEEPVPQTVEEMPP